MGFFGTFETGRLEDPFLSTAGVVLIFEQFCFRIFLLFLPIFGVFQLLGQIWGFLGILGIFRYGWVFLVHLKLVNWKTHLSILQGLL